MLSLLKVIEIQKVDPQQLSKIVISDPIIEFLNQTILGFLYGTQNQNQQDTLNQFNIPDFPTKKNTLIFDLDETLIISNSNPSKAQFSFTLKQSNGDTQQVLSYQIINFSQFYIGVRPYAKEMLEYLSQYYEIIIFTASQRDYAIKIINYLDPESKIIKLLLDRDFCYQTAHGVYIKDLKAFKNLDLQSTLIIDNSSLSYCFQPYNGVPILTWNGNEKDEELIILTKYLINLLEGEEELAKKHECQFSLKTLLKLYNCLNF